MQVADPENLSYLTQTTLSVDETNEILGDPSRAVPRDRGTAPGRHLLRHARTARTPSRRSFHAWTSSW